MQSILTVEEWERALGQSTALAHRLQGELSTQKKIVDSQEQKIVALEEQNKKITAANSALTAQLQERIREIDRLKYGKKEETRSAPGSFNPDSPG
jgi:hypothetical protein